MFEQLYDQARQDVGAQLGPPDLGRGSSEAHHHAAELVAAMRYGTATVASAWDDRMLAALLSQPAHELPDIYARYYALPPSHDRDTALWILKRVIEDDDRVTVALARMVLTGERFSGESGNSTGNQPDRLNTLSEKRSGRGGIVLLLVVVCIVIALIVRANQSSPRGNQSQQTTPATRSTAPRTITAPTHLVRRVGPVNDHRCAAHATGPIIKADLERFHCRQMVRWVFTATAANRRPVLIFAALISLRAGTSAAAHVHEFESDERKDNTGDIVNLVDEKSRPGFTGEPARFASDSTYYVGSTGEPGQARVLVAMWTDVGPNGTHSHDLALTRLLRSIAPRIR